MNFDTYFRLTSYATIFAATLALYIAGGVGSWLALVFVIAMIMAWSAEGSRWQLSERTALIVGDQTPAAQARSRLVLSLSDFIL